MNQSWRRYPNQLFRFPSAHTLQVELRLMMKPFAKPNGMVKNAKTIGTTFFQETVKRAENVAAKLRKYRNPAGDSICVNRVSCRTRRNLSDCNVFGYLSGLFIGLIHIISQKSVVCHFTSFFTL